MRGWMIDECCSVFVVEHNIDRLNAGLGVDGIIENKLVSKRLTVFGDLPLNSLDFDFDSHQATRRVMELKWNDLSGR